MMERSIEKLFTLSLRLINSCREYLDRHFLDHPVASWKQPSKRAIQQARSCMNRLFHARAANRIFAQNNLIFVMSPALFLLHSNLPSSLFCYKTNFHSERKHTEMLALVNQLHPLSGECFALDRSFIIHYLNTFSHFSKKPIFICLIFVLGSSLFQ